MALHTFSLGNIVTNVCRQYGHQATQANWPDAYAYIGLGGYTLTDTSRIQVLNDKIIKHYWFHEIGCDTPGQFAFFMDEAMNLIMPYYDQLYQCEYLKAANLIGVSVDDLYKELYGEKGTRATTASSTGSASTTSHDSTTVDGENSETVATTDRALDTPMGTITNLDDGYLTTGARGDRTTSGTVGNTSASNGTTESEQTTSATDSEQTGKDSNRTYERTTFTTNPSHMLTLYNLGRELLNLDEQVVTSKELHDCFWTLYDY